MRQRLTWRANLESPISDFRMTWVTFGVASSPYLAVQALQQTALDFGEEFPKSRPHIKFSLYVDDLLAGADTLEEATLLQEELQGVLLKGGFDLRKWRTQMADTSPGQDRQGTQGKIPSQGSY